MTQEKLNNITNTGTDGHVIKLLFLRPCQADKTSLEQMPDPDCTEILIHLFLPFVTNH
jgi:hypothetical protein